VLGVVNEMFGATVTTAGLLPGRDVAAAIRRAGHYDMVLIPAEALNDNDVFVDDVALATLRAMFADTRIVPGHELTDCLLQSVECDTDSQL
jgi:NifB/MoaA-like Fe-S oxidoreductase